MARIYTKREARNRKLTFGIFAGMFDYVGTVVSAIIIIICVLIMTQLIQWVLSDFDTSFGPMINMFKEAVVIE